MTVLSCITVVGWVVMGPESRGLGCEKLYVCRGCSSLVSVWRRWKSSVVCAITSRRSHFTAARSRSTTKRMMLVDWPDTSRYNIPWLNSVTIFGNRDVPLGHVGSRRKDPVRVWGQRLTEANNLMRLRVIVASRLGTLRSPEQHADVCFDWQGCAN